MPTPAVPAREMLKLPGGTSIAWAVFDAAWYRATYPNADLDDADDTAVLAFYLDEGQRAGHSPNIWFDEAWHRQTYRGVAAAVRERHVQSAFDSYCRGGYRTRSPHWLFNEALYRQRYPDLQDDALAGEGDANGYDHYLKHGSREGRIGHPMFDPAVYLAQLDPSVQEEAGAHGPFAHYLGHIAARLPEVRASHYFNPLWYLHRYPAVAEAIGKRQWSCALHHYLANVTPTDFDPLTEFSERYYLLRNADVRSAVEANDRRNGFDHFLRNGVFELRSPSEGIDLRDYVNAHPSVRSDLDQGRVRDAFVHYLTVGRPQGLPTAQPAEQQVSEQQAISLFHCRAIDLLPTASRMQLDFTCTGTPAVSVIMLLQDEFPQTLLVLSTLRSNFPGDLELVLIDPGSRDETAQLASYVRGARILRFDDAIGFLPACNAALNCVTAEVVLFLGNAAELAPGAVSAALHRLASDTRIGAVGGKIIRSHGRMQEAGGILWRDGVAQAYLHDASPTAPEANFVRDVDFCSHTFLMARASLLHELEGFDDSLDADYAAADLCVRIAQAGGRIVYDPAIVVHQHSRTPAATAETSRAQEAFLHKHLNELRFRYIADRRAEVFARTTDSARRVLFIDDQVPTRLLGSGFVRSNDIVRVMASIGLHVTVFPVNPSLLGLASIYRDIPDTVEVMHDCSIARLGGFLAARSGYYDVIWIARTHNLDRLRPILEQMTSGTGKPSRIVLDTEAIASLRDAARAALDGDTSFDVDAAIKREFTNAHFCQSIIAVNSNESQKLQDLGFTNIALLGHLRELAPTPRAFAQRAGILFIGAIHETDSPNYDGLVWFIESVLPLVEQALGWETRLTVAGYLGAQVSLEKFRHHPRVTLLGTVAETERLYDTHRIFVAPTRYAAGTPYKVHEAASFGVPVVATELLRRQLGWDNGHDLLSADASDPDTFARHVIALYRDATQWQSLRDNALERIRTENGREPYEAAIRKVMEV